MKRTILLVSLLAALAAVLPATSSATVHKCPANPQGTGYSPRNDRDAPNQVTIVRNISCHAAGWGAVEHGFLTPRGDLRTPGWHCVVLKRGTGTTVTTPGANVRCVRGRKAFRWTWGP
jgi:hypothetical protein